MRETEEQLRKLQETLRRKYTCDRTITVTRLEDLLQDAQVSGLQASAGPGLYSNERGTAAFRDEGRWPSDPGMDWPRQGRVWWWWGCRASREPGGAGAASGLRGCFVTVLLGVETQR